MNFKNTSDIDHLIRKAEWNKTVFNVRKIALSADIEGEPSFDMRTKLLDYLNKDKAKYKKKLKHYQNEYSKVREMIKHIEGGGPLEEIDSLLGGADVEEPFEQMEGAGKDTGQEMADYEETLANRHLLK